MPPSGIAVRNPVNLSSDFRAKWVGQRFAIVGNDIDRDARVASIAGRVVEVESKETRTNAGSLEIEQNALQVHPELLPSPLRAVTTVTPVG